MWHWRCCLSNYQLPKSWAFDVFGICWLLVTKSTTLITDSVENINGWNLQWLIYIRVIHKVTLSSQCLWASFHRLSPLAVISAKLYRHFMKSQYETLQLNIKWWNSASNARGWRLIIVVVQLGAVKIYVQKWPRSGKRKDGMKLYLLPNLMVLWVSAHLEY
jgi:hypothetical protein